MRDSSYKSQFIFEYCQNCLDPPPFHRIGPLGRFDLVAAVSVCLCVCGFDVPFYVVYFEAYFAPTSRSRMSKIFRDSESLGKSAGKKLAQKWIFLLGCGLKLPHKKRLFFADFSLQNMVETTLPDGLETSGQRVYCLFWHISRRFWVFPFWIFFRF